MKQYMYCMIKDLATRGSSSFTHQLLQMDCEDCASLQNKHLVYYWSPHAHVHMHKLCVKSRLHDFLLFGMDCEFLNLESFCLIFALSIIYLH